MLNDLKGKTVLITGGTKGIGLACGLAFGKQGAICTLTHKWGSADERLIRKQFAEVGAPEPYIVEADTREDEDTRALLRDIRERCERIEVFIPGVAFAQIVDSLGDISRRSLLQSIEYTSWPMVGHLQEIKEIFDNYPRYVIGLSSCGPDEFHLNYDVAAACKAMLETFSRYLANRLINDDVRINVVRTKFVSTESLNSTVGKDFEPFVKALNPDLYIPIDDVANAVLALCSGLMDGMSGQVLMVDGGASFYDNLMGLYNRRNERTTVPKG